MTACGRSTPGTAVRRGCLLLCVQRPSTQRRKVDMRADPAGSPARDILYVRPFLARGEERPVPRATRSGWPPLSGPRCPQPANRPGHTPGPASRPAHRARSASPAESSHQATRTEISRRPPNRRRKSQQPAAAGASCLPHLDGLRIDQVRCAAASVEVQAVPARQGGVPCSAVLCVWLCALEASGATGCQGLVVRLPPFARVILLGESLLSLPVGRAQLPTGFPTLESAAAASSTFTSRVRPVP